MAYPSSKLSAVLIFLASLGFLLVYLLSMRWQVYLPLALFWVAIASLLGSIIYQFLRIEMSPYYPKLVLLEIVATSIVLHLIYQLSYSGLYGSDVYFEVASAKGILSSGFVGGDVRYVSDYSYFPMIHIFGAFLSLITNIDLFFVAKWVPLLLDTTFILFLYLLVRRIFKEQRIALLSILLFAFLENHILFSSLFIRETYALVLAACCLYLYFSAKHFSQHISARAIYALSIVCLIGTILAHHLTSFMLLLFFLTHFLLTKAFGVHFFRRHFFGDIIAGEKVTAAFLSIGFSALFAYWLHTVAFPLSILTAFVKSILTPGQWGIRTYANLARLTSTSIQTARASIILYGFYFFNLVFGLVLLYVLLFRARQNRVETYSFTLFLFLCGVIGVLSMYFVAPAVFPDRLLMYGWLFGFSPLAVAILKGRHKWRRRLGVLLLIAFMLFNIYIIDPAAWAGPEGFPAVTYEENYALARTFDFSGGEIFGYQNTLMAIYEVHNKEGTVLSYPKVNLTEFDWIIIQPKILEKSYQGWRVTENEEALEHFMTGPSPNYNKVYDSNGLLVFKRGQ